MTADPKPLTDEEIKDFSEAFANYDGPSIPENFEFIRRLLATIDALRAENAELKSIIEGMRNDVVA